MDPLLQFTLVLAIIILAAKTSGYLCSRLGQPAVLGELLAGLVLGPTLLNMFHWPFFSDPHLEETINHLSHLGVLMLMFVAGLEIDLEMLAKSGKASVFSGVLGVITPILLGMVASLLFKFDLQKSLYMGIVLGATSVSISAQTLMELNVLRTPVGITLLGSALVDDILVILALSIFTALVGGQTGAVGILLVILKMSLFIILAFLVGSKFIPRMSLAVEKLPISEGLAAFIFSIILIFSWTAEALGGMAAITGAFLAGIFVSRTPVRRRVEAKMHTLTYTWLVPVFFVSIGLQADVGILGLEGIPFALTIILVAVFSKILGAGIGARIAGFTTKDATRVGVGMISRGEVGLIVASAGLGAGLVNDDIFASIVLMVLVTTLLTPILLRMMYAQDKSKAKS